MKAIMLSVRPKYVSMILNKAKTIEVRKVFPKDYKGWVYIYCTKNGDIRSGYTSSGLTYVHFAKKSVFPKMAGKVVARFYCDKVEEIDCTGFYEDLSFGKGEEILSYDTKTLNNEKLLLDSCLTEEELFHYLGDKNGYAIHISQLEIFDRPKELSELKHCTEKVCIYGKCHKYMHCLKPLPKAPQSYMFIEV